MPMSKTTTECVSAPTETKSTPVAPMRAARSRVIPPLASRGTRPPVRRTAGRVPLEASGGITLERAARIGATGVDFVSVGALTHSVTVVDLGMDLVER